MTISRPQLADALLTASHIAERNLIAAFIADAATEPAPTHSRTPASAPCDRSGGSAPRSTEAAGDGLVPDADLRLTARIGGLEVSFSPRDLADEHGRIRLASAHATTIYGSQGGHDRIPLVWVDAGLYRHYAFAMSRARGGTRLFVDRASLDAWVRGERAVRTRTPGRGGRAARDARPLLARSGEKASTSLAIPQASSG